MFFEEEDTDEEDDARIEEELRNINQDAVYGEEGIPLSERKLEFNDGDECDDDSELEDELDDPTYVMWGDYSENKMTLDMLDCDYKDMDEFAYFREMVQRLCNANLQAMQAIF